MPSSKLQTKSPDVRISDAKLQAKIGWTPHDGQREVLAALDKRVIVIDAGRRFGKSAICAYIALKTLLEPNKKIWIVAPTYDLSQKVFSYVAKWFAMAAPSQSKGITYKPVARIRTSMGSVLECKTSENPTSLLGDELDLIIMDEASRIQKNIWEMYLFPATASRQGKAIFISTPNGKNWFYHEWLRAKSQNAAFCFPSRSNPTFRDEEWNRAKAMLPANVFSQEYEAVFLDDSSMVFRGINNIVKDNIAIDAQGGKSYIMGVDLGKHNDFSVITVIDTSTNNVVFIDRFNDLDWNIQKARVKMVAERYNNARVVMDTSGVGDPISDDLKATGLFVDDFKYTNKSKQQLIEKLAIFIEQGHLSIPNNVILIDELQSFGYNITDAGRISYGAPSGSHDDCVNSLALAVWFLNPIGKRPTLLKEELRKGARMNAHSGI